MKLDCVTPTLSCVIQIIHCNGGLKCFFKILPKCLFVIIAIYAYFIYISQGSVKMRLWCDGMYITHIVADCPQNQSIIGDDMDKSKVPHFLWAHPVENDH